MTIAEPILVVAVERTERDGAVGTRITMNGDPTAGAVNGLGGAIAFRWARATADAQVQASDAELGDSDPREVIAHVGNALVVPGAWDVESGDSLRFAVGDEMIVALPAAGGAERRRRRSTPP